MDDAYTHTTAFFPGNAERILTLTSSVVAAWPLSEASGQRNDVVGTNHLTDSGSVLAGVGKVGDGAQFVAASSQSLTIADNNVLSVNNESWWLSLWFSLDSVGANRAFAAKYSGAGNFEYVAQYTHFNTRVGLGFNGGVVYSEALGAPSLATFYHAVFYYHHKRRKLGVSINAGVPDEVNHALGTLNGTGAFSIGRLGTVATSFHDGIVDEPVMGKGYEITAADITYLNNAGAGRAWPF
jgi:hypothetical protein